MRIGINTLFLIPGQVGGTETALRGLLSALFTVGADNEYVLYLSRESVGTFGPLPSHVRRVVCPAWARMRPARLLFEQTVLPLLVARHQLDLLHSPGYVSPLVLPCPSVLTVHDANFIRHPETFSFLERLAWHVLVPLSVRRAARLLVPSGFAASEMRAFNVTPERISVTRWATPTDLSPANPETVAAVRKELGLDRPYVLAVAFSHPHKNVARLLDAFAHIRTAGLPHRLVLVGQPRRAHQSLLTKISDLEMEETVCQTGYVSRDILAALYTGADLFVHSSLYEGFGFPVLEAMSCGAPVVCSNAASLPEVAGDAALLVDARSSDALSEAMYHVLTQPDLRSALQKRGFQRVQSFSWQRTARETLEGYRQACAGLLPVAFPPGN